MWLYRLLGYRELYPLGLVLGHLDVVHRHHMVCMRSI